jgi:N-acetylglucosamine-6-phosphate deacetylase
VGISLVDAATICSTTPPASSAWSGHGVLALDAVADLVILDANLTVVQTYLAGQIIYARNNPPPASV